MPGLADHSSQLPSRQHVVDVLEPAVLHLRALALELLRGAGHDRNRYDARGIDRRISRRSSVFAMAPSICCGDLQVERFGKQVRVVVLYELDPAGAAGGELRQHAALRDPLDKLESLLHDGEIR